MTPRPGGGASARLPTPRALRQDGPLSFRFATPRGQQSSPPSMDNSPFAFGQMTPRQAPMTPRLQQVPERQERTRGGVPGLAIPIAETVSPSSSTQPSVCVSPTSPRGPAQPEPQPGEVSPTTMMHHVGGDQDDVELNLESSKWKPNFSPD